MQRKVLFVFLVLALATVLAGCGPRTEPAPGPAPAPKQYNWIAATAVAPADLIAQSVDFFTERVEELSEGQIAFEVHHGGALGGDRDLVEGVRLGTIQMAAPGQALLSGWYPPAEIWTFPYLFDNAEHKDRVWDAIREEYAEDMAKQAGLRPIVGIPRAPRMLSANKVVRTPADMAGLKIRVPETPMWLETFRRFGASPTPLPFPEVFMALQTGIIDGQDNPLGLAWNTGFFKVNTHLNLTEHMMQDNVLVMSAKLYDELPQELKDVLHQAARETETEFRKKVAVVEESLMGLARRAGIVITEVDKAAFIASIEGMEKDFPAVQKWFDRIKEIN